ncbi:arginine N-succinyltransferase [Pelomonas sp. SE-A7]|uniref:arginine N-succinyltransferase n=1 Tax=Pelomonas sp. SE-A7 TaxID=3054953 RepID=UPI00259D193B|nr:arginine N-succinyltransferase [Pelomonas sp. SE-A7]MDM4765687.1 arginine N-succinyltransferase [Pelomonas sp. SE-A7]
MKNQSEQLLLRPCAAADLPALERLAAASVDGISSLPSDREQLRQRIARSEHAFANEDAASGEESYLFVLEDAGRVVGCSGIAASAGFNDRFYSYRNEFVVHASKALGISQRLHTLHLCHDLSGCTLLTSFYIEPAYEDGPAPELLSRARLLFIAAQAERFSERIASEHPGLVDAQGQSPFWDAVGRRFFRMDYPQAERVIGGRSKAFIADLMPTSAVYVTLLPAEAQFALGQLHPVGELPFSMLLAEGFDADSYVDIFDGGPTVEGRLPLLASVRRQRQLKVEAKTGEAGTMDWHLVAHCERSRFRAGLALLPVRGTAIAASHELVQRLGLQRGDRLSVTPLDLAGEASA